MSTDYIIPILIFIVTLIYTNISLIEKTNIPLILITLQFILIILRFVY